MPLKYVMGTSFIFMFDLVNVNGHFWGKYGQFAQCPLCSQSMAILSYINNWDYVYVYVGACICAYVCTMYIDEHLYVLDWIAFV